MSARTSPVRDRRVIVLAAEVAETRDRKVPGVLLGLKCEWTCHIMQRLGGWGSEYSKQNDRFMRLFKYLMDNLICFDLTQVQTKYLLDS